MRTIHLPSLSLIDSWITVKFSCKQSTGNTKTAKAKTALEVGGLLGKPALESTGEALLLGAGVCWACFNGFEVVVCESHFGREQILIFTFQKEPLILFFHKF